MGRTKRIRQRKNHVFQTCSDKSEVILLNSWLVNQKCQRSSKLVLASFNGTGRGVLTKKKILPGDELISSPLNLTINITTILMDTGFQNIFFQNKLDCLTLYRKSISFQSYLAFYLLYLKCQHIKSKWHIYLEILPDKYTVPYFLPNEIKPFLSEDILSIITKQSEIIKSSYDIFKEILMNTVDNELAENMKLLSQSEFEWAYFTVNTRCVFMDLSKILNFNSLENSILELLSDNTNIALCPFVDMINHSASAKNETKLILNKQSKDISIKQLNEEALSDIYFNLYTKNNIEAFTEVFICYGDSHNLKLITEYGFFLPNNDLDCVLFKFEDAYEYLETHGMKLSQAQLTFIRNHGLNKDLYLDCKGLSFNFYALLMVVKSYYKKNVDVSKIIYSAEHVLSENDSLNDFIMPLVRNRLVRIRNEINELEKCEYKCTILENCVALMYQYVNILEKFIKC